MMADRDVNCGELLCGDTYEKSDTSNIIGEIISMLWRLDQRNLKIVYQFIRSLF